MAEHSFFLDDLVASTELSSNTAECTNCLAPLGYTYLNPPHHCRRCNACVCNGCSADRAKITQSSGAVLYKRICSDRQQCDKNKQSLLEAATPWSQRVYQDSLRSALYYAIYGWESPVFPVESTAARGDRYMEEFYGNAEKAFQRCEDFNYSWWSKFLNALSNSIPIFGMFTSLSQPTWRVLRDLCLLAYLNGYDVEDSDVQQKILDCLATPYLTTVASTATTATTIQVAENAAPAFTPLATEILLQQQAAELIAIGGQVGAELPGVAGLLVGGTGGSAIASQAAAQTGATDLLSQASSWGVQQILAQEGAKETLQLTIDSSALASQMALLGAFGFVFVVGIPVNLLAGYLTDKHEEILASGKATFPFKGEPKTFLPIVISDFENLG